MRTITTETNVYDINDVKSNTELLSKALEKHRYINVEFDWWDDDYDNHEESNNSFSITRRYFSGFCSQGDGAMFEYDGISSDLRDEFVDSLNLSPMRKEWLRNNVSVSGKGRQTGHYYHEKSCNHSIYWEVDNGDITYRCENIQNFIESFEGKFEEFVIDRYEDMCSNLYSCLNTTYDYLTSDEAILETLECNEYEFDINGNII